MIKSQQSKNHQPNGKMKTEEIYKEINEEILAKLKEGTVPWAKPWSSQPAANLATKKAYRGINQFLLSLKPFSSPFWATFKQVKGLGGKVKKGSKSSLVVFWKRFVPKDQLTLPKSEQEVRYMLKYYRVFNLEQTEGIDSEEIPTLEQCENFGDIEAAEAIMEGYSGAPSLTEGKEAFYTPSLDSITMPAKESFKDEESYYAVLFHEAIHSTGHKKRLDRLNMGEDGQVAAFKSQSCAKEELVAEMGASFLCGVAGIWSEPDRPASYIQSWMRHIKNDPKALVSAAGMAQKAADHILGIKFD